MRILTSYLIRAHVGPFLFALSTLTGLLFLNAVAQRLEDLAGKGLGWDVIGEFLIMSLPHTVALTLPMAVLVAVLYAFSELTANNEVTAMKAGGVQPQRMMLPLLGMGVIIGGIMLLFNDRVLPQANHELKNLLLDINRKTPTFVLREQVVNQVRAGEGTDVYYLTASIIDNETNELEDVAIYDATDPLNRRTTYAERGVMAFNESRTDLYLTLWDGVMFETALDQPGGFQQIHFDKQVLPIRGVGNEMRRRSGLGDRSDREMTIAMLDSASTEKSLRLDSLRAANVEQTRIWVLRALGRDTVTDRPDRIAAEGPGDAVRPPSGPGPDAPAGVALASLLPRPAPSPAARQEGPPSASGAGSGAQEREPEVETSPPAEEPARWRQPREGLLARDDLTRSASLETNTRWAVANSLEDTVNRYQVEIHKKYSLAFACVVFVLLGGPLAIRFPRGGLGLVIAASSGIFAVYWAGLIGGEKLADQGIAPPALSMWIANIVFTTLGLWLYLTMGRESATARGGGWDDLFWSLRKKMTAPFGPRPGRSAGDASS